MDPFTPKLLQLGTKDIISAGGRSKEVRRVFVGHKAVHFRAIDGSGALLSGSIKKVGIFAYDNLDTKAIFRSGFEDFLVIVVNDIYDKGLLEQAKQEWQRPVPSRDG
jgi:fumarate hydratase subunit beta